MAEPPAPPAVASTHSNSIKPESVNHAPPDPTSNSATTTPAPQQPTPSALQQQSATSTSATNSALNPNSTLNPNPPFVSPLASGIASYVPPAISGNPMLPVAPSFRPLPQFAPLPGYQNPNVAVQPPGVSAPMVVASGAPGAMTVPAQMIPYQVPPGQTPNSALRSYAPKPNGFAAIAGTVPQGTLPSSGIPGIQRHPSPYPGIRPVFPPRPMLPIVARPHVPGIPGVRPIIPSIIRPAIPSITPAEKPQTTVYVGKIAPSVDNDFMLSLLRICGPVKSWKRAQVPTDGTPRAFGFCEFESAEGVLRALRLLSKFNIDGQELMLNVNQATRDYLQRYVEKKTENLKSVKENQAAGTDKEDGTAVAAKIEPSKLSEDSNTDSDKGSKENQDNANFGIVTDEDKEGDEEALQKLTSMIEERLKTRPLPPPPPPQRTHADGSVTTNSEMPAKSRDGDPNLDVTRHTEDKNDDETTSDNKAASEQDRAETSSPDRIRKYNRRSRERDRERDLKREKEREIERFEREAERERMRKEREQRRKIEEAEREYEERLKDWEYREREKEKQRQYEKEKDKERERKRRKEILYDEEGDDDDLGKRWRRSVLEEKRRKRLREKEEDMADRLKEEEEIAEAERRAEEDKLQQTDALVLPTVLPTDHVTNGSEKKDPSEEANMEIKDGAPEHDDEGDSGDEVLKNGIADESTATSLAESDVRHSGNAPTRKLGFGLVGSGKRAAVPSVFHEEDDDDDAHKDKKMRPLVPIDYSTEELQAVQSTVSVAQPPNLAAAAEFAKRISNVNSKEEKPDTERERNRRSHDRSSQRERDRNDDDNRTKGENDKILERDRNREHGLDKLKTPDKQKLLDAKQLIDMIPKTKDELFSYDINWAVYDKHEVHERMRPWISKKITEFLGEEEATLVDYIVTSTQEHVKASQMLEMLQSILDDEAEMFVLKMWRMLIFEIKKVETGLALRSKT